MEDFFDAVIHRYTRQDAIRDGVLIPIDKETVKEADILYDVAFTSNLWNEWIKPSERDQRQGQSIEGRLWDVLTVFKIFAKKSTGNILFFHVLFSKSGKMHKVKLKAVCGPDDDMKPCITIMLENED